MPLDFATKDSRCRHRSMKVRSMTAESWKTVFEIIGIVLLGLTFLDGGMVWFLSRRVNQQQATELRAFQHDLTEAKTELGQQQERAAEAENSTLKLKQSLAAEERATAEARKEAANAELELAKLKA